MKYYLVNYLIVEKKTVTENDKMLVSLHNYANTEELKRSIAEAKNTGCQADQIVIKSYQQITRETFISFRSNNA